MNNCGKNIDKILKKIEKDSMCRQKYIVGPTGPSGKDVVLKVRNTFTEKPEMSARVVDTFINNEHLLDFYIPKGYDGIAETIDVGNTITIDPEFGANVIDVTGYPNHVLDFLIPKGEIGPTGPKGDKGEQGLKGDIGPTGPAGTSVRILGSYDTYEDLLKNHPDGNIGDSYLVGTDLYVWSDNPKEWINVGNISGPKGPKGDKGEQGLKGEKGDIGPTGPKASLDDLNIGTVYFITFNQNYTKEGVEVLENARLPIERKGTDSGALAELENNVITFKKTGLYRVSIIVNGYVKKEGSFDLNTDFVSVGFKKVNNEIIYAGASVYSSDEIPKEVVSEGIFIVNNENEQFELVNLTKKSIYLNSPSITSVNTSSYFATSLVKIVVVYLGKAAY